MECHITFLEGKIKYFKDDHSPQIKLQFQYFLSQNLESIFLGT